MKFLSLHEYQFTPIPPLARPGPQGKAQKPSPISILGVRGGSLIIDTMILTLKVFSPWPCSK